MNTSTAILFLVRRAPKLKYVKDEKWQINLYTDVFGIIRAIEESAVIINLFFQEEIHRIESELKATPIKISEELSSADFKLLLSETKKRYPSHVEEVSEQKVVYWPLHNVEELMSFSEQKGQKGEFQKNTKKAVYLYCYELQNMKFDELEESYKFNSREIVYQLLYPSFRILEILSGEDYHYKREKILSYLPDSLQ